MFSIRTRKSFSHSIHPLTPSLTPYSPQTRPPTSLSNITARTTPAPHHTRRPPTPPQFVSINSPSPYSLLLSLLRLGNRWFNNWSGFGPLPIFGRCEQEVFHLRLFSRRPACGRTEGREKRAREE
ncbi:hypothetical protein E2C01_026185 [Portunus trituberculatus]|uniref:Uncharacterized protein n=1 Tax=Portunus trituberculatus TaxID=210409 RepID=A0A5B7EK10_PORTR|nr:hypothetical protein [Portunus trituberculatus]